MAAEDKESTPEEALSVKEVLQERLKDYESAMRDKKLSPRDRREAQLSVQALRRVIKMF